ncbi:hypothetical protein ACIP6P_13535 [Streptomyces sp. NPDC088729]|uniref:hypothetical protein n=1 Tax=Streptomyces sp. NPDC088729 TaxID=3365876 RepID=UPI003801CA42
MLQAWGIDAHAPEKYFGTATAAGVMIAVNATNDAVRDYQGLLVRMEQNLAEHASHLHRRAKNTMVTESDDLLIADGGPDDDTFNIAAAAPFATRTAPSRAEEVLGALGGTGFRTAVVQASAEGRRPTGIKASATPRPLCR